MTISAYVILFVIVKSFRQDESWQDLPQFLFPISYMMVSYTKQKSLRFSEKSLSALRITEFFVTSN